MDFTGELPARGGGIARRVASGLRRFWARTAVRDALAVAAVAVGLLAVTGAALDLGRFHFALHLNDQAGYITAARSLAETGELRSHVIYPSVLYQETTQDVFYLPGVYWVLAAAYRLFGYGEFQSLLPALISFVVTAVAAYLLGARLHGRRAGLVSATLVACFPYVLFYAFTAMTELPLLAASTLALCVLVHLPERARPWAAPLLLLLPMIFRETAVFLALPMALLVAFGGERRRLAAGVGCLAGCGALATALLASPLGAGRPSLLLANLFDPTFGTIYLDAVAQRAIRPALADWGPAILANTERSGETLRMALSLGAFDAWMFVTVGAVALAITVAGVVRRDAFEAGSGVAALSVLALVIVLYSPEDHRGVRNVLLFWPGLAVALAAAAARWAVRGMRPLVLVAAALVLAMLAHASVRGVFGSHAPTDEKGRQAARLLELLGHDDRRALVMPLGGATDYLVPHYPVTWSFPPANAETLDLLTRKVDVGTLIIPGTIFERGFGLGEVERFGFQLERSIDTRETYLLIFRCPLPRCGAGAAR